MRTVLLTFCILLVLVLCMLSCAGRPEYPHPLQAADSIADADPDSAIALLSCFEDTVSCTSRADSMYCALLKIKAADKSYTPGDTAGGILDIVRYYEDGGDRHLLPMAYYYAASAYRDCGKPAIAVGYFYKAADAAGSMDDNTISALSNAQMGTLFRFHKMYDYALTAFLQAYHYDSLRASMVDVMFDLRDLGNVYADLGNRKKGILYLDSALVLAKRFDNKKLVSSVSLQLARYYIEAGRYVEAERHLNVARAYNDSVERSSVLSVASHLFRKTGRAAEALECDRQLAHSGNVFGKREAYQRLLQYYTSKNVEDSISYALGQFRVLSDSIENQKAHELVAEKKFATDFELRMAQMKEETGAIRFVIIVLFCAVCFIVVLFFVFLHRRKQEYAPLADGVCDMDSSSLAADTEYDTAAKENTSKELADLPIVHKIKALCDENGTESGCLPTLEDWEALDKGVNQVCADFKKHCLISLNCQTKSIACAYLSR